MLHKDPAFIGYCRLLLDQFVADINGIEYVCIATSDGFEVASKIVHYAASQGSGDKLAAVASSIMALGISLAGEFGLQRFRSINVDSETGKITLRPINTPQQPFILLVQSGADGLLGHILHGGAKINSALIERASQYPPPPAS